ncbi:hypothetical protein NL676_032251 [Syzygium grande]|nr:hypothetical protein NL676_032251 [Syzygium grande]
MRSLAFIIHWKPRMNSSASIPSNCYDGSMPTAHPALPQQAVALPESPRYSGDDYVVLRARVEFLQFRTEFVAVMQGRVFLHL